MPISNTTFLDAFGDRLYTDAQYQTIAGNGSSAQSTLAAFFWAFAQANEMVAGQTVGHLWNYGLNTWGWEDTFGGGDHDFNDLVVQLDFTSAHGHGWLV
jgi:hypothetical protein